MPIFNFYSYKIQQTHGTGHLFGQPAWQGEGQEAPPPAYATAEECFGSYFQTGRQLELCLMKTKGKDSKKITWWDKYRCDTLRQEEGVILLTIENNKVKHTIVDKKERENEHHPYCHVVIDNRPGRQMLGIERSGAFDSHPDKVADLLAKGMTHRMAPYHYTLELTHLKKKSTEFWPVVHELRTRYGDVVKQIRLDFNGREERSQAQGLIDLMSRMAQRAESEAVFMLNAPDDGEVKLQEVYDDLTGMADICLRQRGYDLTVKFGSFGVYRYGADLLAQFGADDALLQDFEGGVKRLDFDSGAGRYELVEWLDKLADLLSGYEQHTIQTGRKSRRRR